MSSSLPHNISPTPPEQFHEMHFPHWHLILRIALATIALSYAFFVPSKLLLITYSGFLICTIVYVAAQGLLGLSIIFNRAHAAVLHAISAIDVAAVLGVLMTDPSAIPPSALLIIPLLTLSALQHRLKSFMAIFTVTTLLFIAALSLHQQLLQQQYDIYFFSTLLFIVAGAGATPLLASQAEALRLRAARVTETDSLTGLGNRWTFYEAAKYLLPYHQRNMTPMVVMFAEVEVTKHKGKRVGKSINQYLLKQFASIADNRLRACDIAAHYGGNEFAFLLVDTSTKGAEAIAFEMQQQFDNWAKQKDLPAYVHVGLSIIPNRPIALDQILLNVNAALHRARQYKKGVSGAVFADPEQVR